jgi:hypothetical protein
VSITGGSQLFNKLSIQSILNPKELILIEFSMNMKQKFCHLLFALANLNCWVTYTQTIWEKCITVAKRLIVYQQPLNIHFQSCAQLMTYHTVRFNTAYPHKQFVFWEKIGLIRRYHKFSFVHCVPLIDHIHIIYDYCSYFPC